MSRANAGCAPVRADTILGVARSLTHPLYHRFESLEPAFRTAIPALVGLFLVILGAGALFQTSAMREDTLADAAGDMDLVSALVARELDAATLTGKEPAAVLAALATRHLAARGRFVHVSGADGRVVASEPVIGQTQRTLVDFLGQTQPLTVFGDRAGVMRITLPNGADVFASVRNLAAPLGQVAVLQPVSQALSTWQIRRSGLIILFGAAGLVLSFITLAFMLQSKRASAADQDCDCVRERIDTALNRGHCGLWDWDLARGRIYWSDSMYALLGYDRAGEYLSLIHI